MPGRTITHLPEEIRRLNVYWPQKVNGIQGGQLDLGWKWDCTQADAVIRLNVSRSVVQRLWDQYQSEDSVSKTCSRPTTSWTTPAKTVFKLFVAH
ncbi:hypothetical protein TNCV_3360571 [Trichonephila clavipes]|nr:hypothetical protein TNCV_3360571 [Trichonephila clavipes]